jgi:hypothetical protein
VSLASGNGEQILFVDDDAGVRDVSPSRCGEGLCGRRGTDGVAPSRPSGRYALVGPTMLPGISGVEVCRALRAESDVPILMLTPGRRVRPGRLELGATTT